MTAVQLSISEPVVNRQPPRKPIHPRRAITGAGQHPRRRNPQFHLPTGPSPQQLQEMRNVHMAEEELKKSATGLLKNSAGLLTGDERHAKRFKKEVDTSTAIPYLLKNHLGWVSGMPELGQLAALVAEKWVRTKFEAE